MSGFVFGKRIGSSVSTFAVAALLSAVPVLVAGNASATTPASPATVTTTNPAGAPTAASPTQAAPKVEQKVESKHDAVKADASKIDAGKTDAAKPGAVQVATTPKAEVSKTQADAVAKELGGKSSDGLSVTLGKYSEQMRAAAAIKDSAQRTKAVTEARQQLSSIGGKPVTTEQAAKIDSILGLPATVQ